MTRSELRARWNALAPREKTMAAAAAALVAAVLIWLLAVGPALGTLRNAEGQHRTLDAQLQRMRTLQSQAQALQAQPKQNSEQAGKLLEQSVTQRLGTSARTAIAGERVTVTLTGTPPDALAQWLAQARANARALPSEARLQRNANGLWDGSLVLTLPPR